MFPFKTFKGNNVLFSEFLQNVSKNYWMSVIFNRMYAMLCLPVTEYSIFVSFLKINTYIIFLTCLGLIQKGSITLFICNITITVCMITILFYLYTHILKHILLIVWYALSYILLDMTNRYVVEYVSWAASVKTCQYMCNNTLHNMRCIQ